MNKTVGLTFWGAFFMQYILIRYFSTYVFDQFTLVILFTIMMLSPLIMTILLKLLATMNKLNLAYVWGIWAIFIAIGQVVLLVTENLMFYNVFIGILVGTVPIVVGFCFTQRNMKFDAWSYFTLACGVMGGVFLNLIIGMMGLGLTDIAWNSIMIGGFFIFAGFFLIDLKKNATELPSQPGSTVNGFNSRKSKIMVLLMAAIGWGLWQFLIQDIFMYPAMISAKTRVGGSSLYFPLSILTIGFTIGFFCFGLIFVMGIQNPASKIPRFINSKRGLGILNLFVILGFSIYAYGEGFVMGFIILAILPVLILDFTVLCHILKESALQPWQLMFLIFIANVVQFFIYVYHYFYQQLPWIPILGGIVFTTLSFLIKTEGGISQ